MLKIFGILKNKISKMFLDVYITSKMLLIIGFLCFIIITISAFDSNLDATGNVVTIRTLFSSIIGFILENESRKILCEDTFVMIKNYTTGLLSIAIVLILGATIIFSIDVNNPSLILLKNVLFSCVGFLISTSKECE